MESLSFFTATLHPKPPHHRPNSHLFQTKSPRRRSLQSFSNGSNVSSRALKSPRGFGPSAPNKPNKKKKKRSGDDDDDDSDTDEDDDNDDVAIPEAVTNRMMRRMGLSVGIPLTVGLAFFPFFYYLKAVAKVDVPTWVPFLVSFVFFGAALLGVSYGIVSASWDPLREGSLLGWNEVRRNWPLFWASLWGGGRPGGGGGGPNDNKY